MASEFASPYDGRIGQHERFNSSVFQLATSGKIILGAFIILRREDIADGHVIRSYVVSSWQRSL